MKSNKRIHSLILIGLIFTISIIITNTSNDKLISNENLMDDTQFVKNISPKASSFWNNFTFIHIDGNWTAANVTDWCRGEGTLGNPYILENISIDASSSPTGSGIFINNSKNDYFTIKNCTIYNADNGIYDGGIKLENTENGTLLENNCSNNGQSGIFLYDDCRFNTIMNNTLKDNVYGVHFWDNCYQNSIINNSLNDNVLYGAYIIIDCDDNTISRNSANENGVHGISLQGGSDFNNISENSAIDNVGYGVYLETNCNNNTILGNNVSNIMTSNQIIGIYLMASNNCTISSNIAKNNNWNGIKISQSANNTLLRNTVINNTNSGILLQNFCYDNKISGNLITNNSIGASIDDSSCENNIFYNNTFIGNNLHADDRSDPLDNQWDNGNIGNYWDNYSGVDWNDDGIGNIPYEYIGGSAGSVDNCPLWWDAPHIVINSPINNMEYANAPLFNIEINCISSSMWYSLDGGATNITISSNSSISKTLWNQLENGYVTLTFFVNDSKNYLDIESILILKNTPPQSEVPDNNDYEDLINDLQANLNSVLTFMILLTIIIIALAIALIIITFRSSRKINQLRINLTTEKSKISSEIKRK